MAHRGTRQGNRQSLHPQATHQPILARRYTPRHQYPPAQGLPAAGPAVLMDICGECGRVRPTRARPPHIHDAWPPDYARYGPAAPVRCTPVQPRFRRMSFQNPRQSWHYSKRIKIRHKIQAYYRSKKQEWYFAYRLASQKGSRPMLERLFQLSAHNTSIRTEIVAGITTFLTMSYIIFVNPEILSTTGMDRDAVFVATCLAAAVGSLVMALLANWPVAMAPGMGLNAFFAFTIVGAMGYTWQQALGAVFISGVIFVILTATGIRRWLIDGIPPSLRSAIVAGLGLF